jgi:hypothetical protein
MASASWGCYCSSSSCMSCTALHYLRHPAGRLEWQDFISVSTLWLAARPCMLFMEGKGYKIVQKVVWTAGNRPGVCSMIDRSTSMSCVWLLVVLCEFQASTWIEVSHAMTITDMHAWMAKLTYSSHACIHAWTFSNRIYINGYNHIIR